MPTPHSRWLDQFHGGSQAPIFKLQMSEMKDFMISSLLLYGHVPGGAVLLLIVTLIYLEKGNLCL